MILTNDRMTSAATAADAITIYTILTNELQEPVQRDLYFSVVAVNYVILVGCGLAAHVSAVKAAVETAHVRTCACSTLVLLIKLCEKCLCTVH